MADTDIIVDSVLPFDSLKANANEIQNILSYVCIAFSSVYF